MVWFVRCRARRTPGRRRAPRAPALLGCAVLVALAQASAGAAPAQDLPPVVGMSVAEALESLEPLVAEPVLRGEVEVSYSVATDPEDLPVEADAAIVATVDEGCVETSEDGSRVHCRVFLGVRAVVPALVDRTGEEALELLAAAGLGADAPGLEDPAAQVVRAQKPQAGEWVRFGSGVWMDLSPAAGPGDEGQRTWPELPDLEGRTLAEAGAALAGLAAARREVVEAYAQVVLTEPEQVPVAESRAVVVASDEVCDEQSRCRIVLEVGAIVPPLGGRSASQAAELVAAAGLRLAGADATQGRIVGQRPEPGAWARFGDVVQVQHAGAPRSPSPLDSAADGGAGWPWAALGGGVLLLAGAGTVVARGVGRARGRRWVHQHVEVRGRPGPAAEPRTEQAAGVQHTVGLRGEPGPVEQSIEEVRP